MKRFTILTILFTLLTANAFAQDRQFLFIKFTPEDATLEINGEVKATKGGEYHELLPLGEHTYKLYKDGYTATSGTVRMVDRYQTHNMKLSLKQPIAYISIANKQNLTGASVYIDDTYVGELPVDNFQVSSGSHILAIKHPLHKTSTTLFRLADEESKTLSPTLIRSHVIITIESSEKADIFVNDKLIGKESCKDTLVIGRNYKFESRLPSHTPNPLYCTIGLNDDNRVVKLPNPTPIYGGLKISSTLPDAKIYLDGNHIGNTPCKATQILVGEHTVSMTYNGYQSSKPVIISKGEEAEVFFELPHGSLSLTSSPSQAEIYIDNNLVGTTPKYIPEIWPGEYTVTYVYNQNWLESKTFTICIEDGEFEELSENKVLGSLNITSKPSNATVEINDIEIGQTPLTVPKIWTGEYILTLKYPTGYKQIETINVHEGENDLFFETDSTALVVTSDPKGVNVNVDGNLMGVTPLKISDIKEGEHNISIRFPSGETQSMNVYIKPQETTEVNFETKYGSLIVQSSHPNSDVYIDGEHVGQTPIKNKAIEAGEHSIDIKLSGSKAYTRQVTIEKGQTTTINFNTNYYLEGREIVGSIPVPDYSISEEGTVVVSLKVDKNGYVVGAKAGYAGTNLTSKEAWDAAEKAAMKIRFTSKEIAPAAYQYGTITYVFKIGK